jgi:hypothetical protein
MSRDEGAEISSPKKWMSVPEAGRIYYGLSRNGSYDAAERGEIPTVRVGRLLKVPVHLMEEKFSQARPHGRGDLTRAAPARRCRRRNRGLHRQ